VPVRIRPRVPVPVEQVGTRAAVVLGANGFEPVTDRHASAARRVAHRIRNPEEGVRASSLALGRRTGVRRRDRPAGGPCLEAAGRGAPLEAVYSVTTAGRVRIPCSSNFRHKRR
jgi:hypothetical protein